MTSNRAGGVFALALAAAIAAFAAPDRGAAQDKAPAFVIAAPTAAQLAPRAPLKPLAMDLNDARVQMGWPAFLATRSITGLSKTKVAIVDAGFTGIEEWLAAHPEERERTTLVGAAQNRLPGESDHGYLVYRVMRSVAADAQLLLYRTDRTATSTYNLLVDAATKGVVIANVSLGHTDAAVVAGDDATAARLHALLNQSEMFVFYAAGNERGETHTWVSNDRDGDGNVDFYAQRPQEKVDVDEVAIRLRQGPNQISVAWDVAAFPQASYTVELRSLNGALLASVAPDAAGQRTGVVDLAYQAAAADIALVSVKRMTGPASGVTMRLVVDAALALYLNGLQSAPNYSMRENPFLVYVGAFGKTAAGTLAPSEFSNFGARPDGTVYPHVLGPGQVLVDGKDTQGTSFASPFLTAIYGFAQGYNIKNVMQRSASFARIDPAVPEWERSRWGVADQFKVWGAAALKTYVTGATKIENVSHARVGDDIVVKFTVTRCCMEAMTWSVGAYLFDPATGAFLTNPQNQQPIQGTQTLRTDTADYNQYPVEVKIPVASLGPATGRELGVGFSLSVRTWAAAQGTFKPDEAPAYRLKL